MNPLDLTSLAHEAGATHLVDAAPEPQLCTQLAYHLTQLQRMLGASEAECNASIKEVTLLRALAELAIDQRRVHGDPDRDALERWLDIERRKFLMATKADTLAMLGERIVTANKTRPGLRRAANTAVDALLRESLAAFRQRVQPGAQVKLASIPRQIVDDLEHALGHATETVPLATIAKLPVKIHAFARDVDHASAGLGLFTRMRIERFARDELAEGIDRGTRRTTHLVLRDYDDIRAGLEQHVLETIDAWIETARSAAAFARRARDTSGEYTARAQVARWFMALAKISAGLS